MEALQNQWLLKSLPVNTLEEKDPMATDTIALAAETATCMSNEWITTFMDDEGKTTSTAADITNTDPDSATSLDTLHLWTQEKILPV